MATSFRPYAPDQDMLLPPSLREWPPEGHLTYFISDTIDALDLSAFFARYANGGPRNLDELLERAKRTDSNEADLDLPAEIARRENSLKEITAARERLEQLQREAVTARGRSE